VEFQNSVNKASSFRPLFIQNGSDKCLPTCSVLQVSFQHAIIKLTSFIGTPDSNLTFNWIMALLDVYK